MNKKLLIVDTFYFLHRSFHAFPMTMSTSDGIPTNVLYGFSSSLIDLILKFSPSHVLCSWESEEQPSFRKELFVDYQAHREPGTPEEEEVMSLQIPLVKKLLEKIHVVPLMENGFEGDDVIGTAAAQAAEKMPVVIATSDQDMMQLVTDEVSVFRPARPPFLKELLFSPQEVRDHYSFSPIQMVDYKALRGDPSDNIPGVKGIGEKTAKDLIRQFQTLDSIYDHLSDISPAVQKKLTEQKEMAYLSKQLATIITTIPLPHFDIASCAIQNIDTEALREACADYEFKSLMKKIDKLERLQEQFVPEQQKSQSRLF